MGGSSVSDDWEVIANEAQTILMIGCRGEGKSATNNSIHGRNAFQLRSSSGGVTSACEIQRTRLEDGKILDVIDTPGFDFNVESVLVVNEIGKCIDLADNGVHAILFLFLYELAFQKKNRLLSSTLRSSLGPKLVIT
uniref:NTGP4 n=1 Tax=Solanum tuberosum TaxID=4113 RepID=M1DW79_SOLTU